jgi:UDP-N-acetylmuramoyl-tripeptide--D-alanyl-D-alanine ligase
LWDIEIPLVGAHNGLNLAAALACALALDIAPEETLADLRQVTIPGGRFRALKSPRGYFVIDDTYNANPSSMHAAFATLNEIARGRKVAILADMRELGETSAQLHQEVGRAAAQSGIACISAFGEHAGEIVKGASKLGCAAKAYADMGSLLKDLPKSLHVGDYILVKGSHSMHCEQVVQFLMMEHP